jgi:DNA helicase HerA-like ATPase
MPETALTPVWPVAGLQLPQLPRLPGPRDRLAVIGRTGSGKTHFANWALSLSNFDRVPWVIIDYKHDDLIKQLPRLAEIKPDGRDLPKPKHAGLYVTHPLPLDSEAVEALLWAVWKQGRTGVYIDEAHILPDKGGLQAILTQGRSKNIPAIVLTQRPSWVSRFVFSEADYYSVFHLNDSRDRKTVGAFVPVDMERILPTRHSWYHDVAANRSYQMRPVPDRDFILETVDERSRARWKRI